MKIEKSITKCDVCKKEVTEVSPMKPVLYNDQTFADICKPCADRLVSSLFPKPRKPRTKKPKATV